MGGVLQAARPAALAFLTAVPLLALALAGCDDGRKRSEQAATDTLAKVAPVLTADVEEVRRGLPAGAAKLGPMLDPDTLADPVVAVRKAITRTRNLVPDLDVAKSTFFSYADATGKVVRSESDPDVLEGKSIIAAFPALKKALDGTVAEGFGENKELRGVRNGPDLMWVAAAPVKDGQGKVAGLFVTGWSLRLYARRLETAAVAAAREAADKAGRKNPALVYVFVIKGKTAYGTPIAPDVNATALEILDLLGKTAAGPYHGTLEITDRGFGVAAARAPELGDDAALAVLATEI
jgi:hypothetical protein